MRWALFQSESTVGRKRALRMAAALYRDRLKPQHAACENYRTDHRAGNSWRQRDAVVLPCAVRARGANAQGSGFRALIDFRLTTDRTIELPLKCRTFTIKPGTPNSSPSRANCRRKPFRKRSRNWKLSGLTLQSIGHAPVESILARRCNEQRPTLTSAREVIEQTILRTHLAKVLEGGRAIVPALQAFSEEMPAGRRRNELHKLIRILERGDATEAEKAFAELPEYWIPLLSAAISSSDPGRILQEFIRESQRADELRRQWWLMLVVSVSHRLHGRCCVGPP